MQKIGPLKYPTRLKEFKRGEEFPALFLRDATSQGSPVKDQAGFYFFTLRDAANIRRYWSLYLSNDRQLGMRLCTDTQKGRLAAIQDQNDAANNAGLIRQIHKDLREHDRIRVVLESHLDKFFVTKTFKDYHLRKVYIGRIPNNAMNIYKMDKKALEILINRYAFLGEAGAKKHFDRINLGASQKRGLTNRAISGQGTDCKQVLRLLRRNGVIV